MRRLAARSEQRDAARTEATLDQMHGSLDIPPGQCARSRTVGVAANENRREETFAFEATTGVRQFHIIGLAGIGQQIEQRRIVTALGQRGDETFAQAPPSLARAHPAVRC